MNDRDRLIELITKEVARPKAYALADHLLANGVIVPPCKVGDTVYRIANNSKTIIEEQIGNANIEFTIDNGTGIRGVWWLKDYNIGKTVFLTKEEAEEKLKEMNNNG